MMLLLKIRTAIFHCVLANPGRRHTTVLMDNFLTYDLKVVMIFDCIGTVHVEETWNCKYKTTNSQETP